MSSFDFGESAMDLLKFGISKKYDTEPKETIIIREPAVQHQVNDAGKAQQVGSTNANKIETVPPWVKYTVMGLAGVTGVSLLYKAVS